jgi:ubiquitin C-terminal hydrolase
MNNQFFNSFSIIRNLMYFVSKVIFTCTTCKTVFNNFELFNCLSLSIPNIDNCSIYDCINNFIKEETISNFCPMCNSKTLMKKNLLIRYIPRYLIVQFNRFNYDYDKKIATKNKKSISIPTTLIIEPRHKLLDEYFSNHIIMYHLYGFIEHKGPSINNGHYIAYTKYKDKWFMCNDSTVKEITTLFPKINIDGSPIMESNDVYLLFYEL